MEFPFIMIICIIAFCFLLSSEANQYHVEWNDKPKRESYNHWSKKTSFAVHDTIVFTYPDERDSVLFVRPEDYKTCNNTNPVKRWYDGSSEVELYRTGVYFFIGGNNGSCQKGQRLRVFVPEFQPPPPPLYVPPSSAPSPSSPPPTSRPVTPTLSPSSPAANPTWPPRSGKAPSPAPNPPPSASPPALPPSVTPDPTASTPQPSLSLAPAPAPSSAWSVTPRRLLVPAVPLLLGGFIGFFY